MPNLSLDISYIMHTVMKGVRRGRIIYEESKSRRTAHGARDKILENRGLKALPKSEVRAIERYAKRKFGSKKYAPWLITYTLHRGAFFEGWVPEEFFRCHVVPRLNPPAITAISNVKTQTSNILGCEHTPDIALFVNGNWISPYGRKISSCNIKQYVFRKTRHVVAKADFKDRGSGIAVLTDDDFDHFFESRSKQNFVIQTRIVQNPRLSTIYADAVATIRIITMRQFRSDPAVRAAYLRVGRKGFSFVSAAGNQIKIPIVNDDGDLGRVASDEEWNSFEFHPDTEVKFEGIRVPMYREAVELCKKLHWRVPQFGYIGWDIAICNECRIWVLEWNTVFPAFAYIEATSGPLFNDVDVRGVM